MFPFSAVTLFVTVQDSHLQIWPKLE